MRSFWSGNHPKKLFSLHNLSRSRSQKKESGDLNKSSSHQFDYFDNEEVLNQSLKSKNTDQCRSEDDCMRVCQHKHQHTHFKKHLDHVMKEMFADESRQNQQNPYLNVKFLNCDAKEECCKSHDGCETNLPRDMHHRPRDCADLDNCKLVQHFQNHHEEATFIKQ